MKLRILTFLWLSLFFMSSLFASPPSAVVLGYDSLKEILHISASHISDRSEYHYLWRIKVYKNDVLDKTKNYFNYFQHWLFFLLIFFFLLSINYLQHTHAK